MSGKESRKGKNGALSAKEENSCQPERLFPDPPTLQRGGEEQLAIPHKQGRTPLFGGKHSNSQAGGWTLGSGRLCGGCLPSSGRARLKRLGNHLAVAQDGHVLGLSDLHSQYLEEIVLLCVPSRREAPGRKLPITDRYVGTSGGWKSDAVHTYLYADFKLAGV